MGAEQRSDMTDLAIIGGSLLGVTKALMAAPTVRSTIFEASARIGGCWDNASGLGVREVENGTHMFFHERQDRTELYGIMREVLGAELYEMEPFPHICFRPHWPIYPLEGRQNGRLTGMMRSLERARAGERPLKNRLRAMRYGSKYLWSLVHYYLLGDNQQEMFRYRYVTGGMPALMATIGEKLAATPDVAVETNASVARIVYEGSAGYRLVLADGREARARGVMLTAGSIVDEIEDREGDRLIRLPFESNVTQHINFTVREPGEAKPFTFVEFYDLPLLRWLTDITEFCRPPLTDGRRMCCVRIHGAIEESQLDAAMDEIAQELRAAGYLSNDAEVLDKMLLSYTSRYRSDPMLNEINAQLPPGAKMYYSRYFFKSLLRLFEGEPELLTRGDATPQKFAVAAE